MSLIPYPQRLVELADAAPDAIAVTCGAERLTRGELVDRAVAVAAALTDDVGEGDLVTIGLPNSVDWFTAYVATLLRGAVPAPVPARITERELGEYVELARPSALIGPDSWRDVGVVAARRFVSATEIAQLPTGGPWPRSFAVSPAWKAPLSGGSTGRPKVIVCGDPALFDPQAPPPRRMPDAPTLIVPAPLHHNAPLMWSVAALLAGGNVVLLERFDPAATLAGIEEHAVQVAYLVPTMMRRILELPDHVRRSYDLSSLQLVWHLAEPCPDWVKRAWIDWLGPERIWEAYGGTEGLVRTELSGAEWLEHPGSVGRPVNGDLSIRDEAGRPLPSGETGEIWMRTSRSTPSYHYIGGSGRRSSDGLESIGDLGRLDDDGYLYLSGRVDDVIVVGGVNVQPAEIEAELERHIGVHSAAVIGLPDSGGGTRVHAVVHASDRDVSAGDLLSFVEQRLTRHKVPRSVEFVGHPLRDDAGKVRRKHLRAERI